jgi:hypothetical protein
VQAGCSLLTPASKHQAVAFACVVISLIAVLLGGCSLTPTPLPQIAESSSKAEVLALMGEPDHIQEFILPAEPFFGPQEALVNLVPAETLIEEWQYEIEDELLYI